jgi:hypothetical protein
MLYPPEIIMVKKWEIYWSWINMSEINTYMHEVEAHFRELSWKDVDWFYFS